MSQVGLHDIAVMLADMLAGAVGGPKDRWLELIGPVESLPVWNAVQLNWRITPIATGEELSAINTAAELLRAQQPYVTA